MSSFGRMVSGGANVLRGFEAGQERQRAARLSQLAIEEQNRLARMKQQLAAQAGTMFDPAEVGVPDVRITPGAQMPVEAVTVPMTREQAAATAVGAQTPEAIEQRRLDTMRSNSRAAQAAAMRRRRGEGAEPQGMTQQERDRVELMRAPAAVLDIIQSPAAAGLNVFGSAVAGTQNVAGRVVNAITGEPILPTDVRYSQFSMTPFYDRFVRQPEAAAAQPRPMTLEEAFDGPRRRTVEAPSSERPTQQVVPNFNTLAAAVEQVESGGREDAVSPRGALGPMQTMPGTLTDPGFGVRPAQNNSPEEMRRVGQDYLQAMLNKYNGNLDHALAAYNWGPTNVDKWVAAGADPSKLPKETREYIPKVKAAMGATSAQTVSTPLTMPRTQRENVSMAEQYLANPESIPFEMQQINQLAQQQLTILTQQRNENARLAQIMMQSGTAAGIESAMAMRNAINEQDLQLLQVRTQAAEKMMYLQGMQGLREFATANDPRRLSGVLSQFMGVPVAIQPRSDGTYNYFVNGRRVKEGVSAAEVASVALREFSPEARAAAAQSAALENELALKQKYGDAVVNAMKAIQVAIINGEYGVAKEHAKKQGLEVRPDTSTGTWAVIRDGQSLYMINPSEVTRTKTRQGEIVTPPPARQITGINLSGR